ncbi:MAG: PAS domain S-box protein [Cytophagaceae bacterium]|nr:PAS domain S-box protein [Gemmatimonadaceae bacterium]
MAPRLAAHPRRVAGVTLVVGLLTASAAATWQSGRNEDTRASRFEEVVVRETRELVSRVQSFESGLRSVRGVVMAAGPDQLTRETFRAYIASRELEREFPGARGFGFMRRVPTGAESAFVALARRNGSAGFSIHSLGPVTSERYIVQYIEPADRNPGAVGLDIASDPQRRAAARRAINTGAATLTPPIKLVQASGATSGAYGFFLPVYRAGAPLGTSAERDAAAIGFTFAPLVMSEVFASFDAGDDLVSIRLDDVTAEGQQAIYRSPVAHQPAARGLTRVVTIPVHGRAWRAELRAQPRFVSELNLRRPALVFARLAVLTIVLAIALAVHGQSRDRERQVYAEQRRRGAIVESSSDAIIAQALDGTITDWNRGAERLFGFRAGATIGLLIADVLLPDHLRAEDDALVAQITRGESVVGFETQRLRADGSLVDVSLTASPIVDAEGRLVGLSKTLRDVSAARQEARRVQHLNASLEDQMLLRTAELASAMRDNDALLRTMREHSIVSVTDRFGIIQDVNENFCRLSGYTREALVGQSHRMISSGTMPLEFWSAMWSTVSSGQPWRGEVCNRTKDGALYWVDSMVIPFADANNQVEKYISVQRDITKAKAAEAQLRTSEQFLERAGEVAGIGGWEFDLRHGTATWTAQTYRIHEVPLDYVPTMEGALSHYAPEARVILERAVEEGIRTGAAWDVEVPFTTSRGRRIWVRSVGTAERENGEVVRLVGAFQDVSARKEAELSLQHINERFSIAAGAAGIGVWEYDIASHVMQCDDQMYRLYGRPIDAPEAPLVIWDQSLHPDDCARVNQEVIEALHGVRAFDTEFRVIRPNGDVRHLKSAARVVRDADQRPVSMTGVNFDITERKRAELTLQETSALLRTVLESASEVSIIATDPDFRIKVFNRGAEQLLGYSSEEIIGHATPLLIHDADEVARRGADLAAEVGAPIVGAEVFSHPSVLRHPRDWTYIRKDGARIAVSLVVTAMYDAGGALSGYLGVAHDVTRRVHAEQSMRDAMLEARQASHAKSQFLANMSHEIRTPMNAVIGLSYLMARTPLAPDQEALMGKITQAGKSLLGVINDILDLTKIEAGELVIERVPFDLHALLKDVSDVITVSAEARGIAYRMDLDSDVPARVEGDPTRVSQVLTNLLSNAVKFTDVGAVHLRGSRVTGDDQRVDLRFTIRDTGIGIPEAVLARLFTPFAQADASTTRRFGGTGLGLSIVKRLAEMLEGDVGVTSTPGIGSEFVVSLSFDVPAPSDRRTPPVGRPIVERAALRGVRILVADDNEINLEVALRVLELAGATVTLVRDGQQAVHAVEATPTGFDIILMDVQMPVLDGNEATMKIRRELGLTTVPILALTAGVLVTERERSIDAGMNGVISKPFEPAALVQAIRGLVPSDTVEIDAEAVARGIPQEWPTIDGIDMQDVRTRVGGDVDLFRSLLGLMVTEFPNALLPDDRSSPDWLALHARRMHKLKGSAGTLGAIAIFRMATEAEGAGRTGDLARVETLAHELTRHLEALAASARAYLLDASTHEAGSASTAPLDLQGLVDALRQQNFAAMDRFKQATPPLRRLMTPAAFERLRSHIANLEFGEAAAVLEAVRSTGPGIPAA